MRRGRKRREREEHEKPEWGDGKHTRKRHD
jgi:hypothetical protein